MRFLIVDDDAIARKILGRILQDAGTCDTACDGEEALMLYKAAMQESLPYDLILLDIEMPKQDGHAVLRTIRNLEGETSGKRSCIVMATSHTDKNNVVDSFRGQCDGFVCKPYSAVSLRNDLQKYGLWPPGKSQGAMPA